MEYYTYVWFKTKEYDRRKAQGLRYNKQNIFITKKALRLGVGLLAFIS